MTELLFSYGTLQRVEVQLRLFGRRLDGQEDSLPGYTTVTIEIKDETFLKNGDGKFQKIASASENVNEKIEGTVFEVSAEELAHADKYEPEDYKRIRVILSSGKEAWIYAAK